MEKYVKTKKTKKRGRADTGSKATPISFDPQQNVINRQFTEQSQGAVVLSFGRMNPPTAGHEKLVNKIVDVARRNKAVPMLFTSHSQDRKKNPIGYDDKVDLLQRAFGSLVQKDRARNLIEILKQLQSRFTRVIIVVGSDRVREFDTLLNKYNGREYKFDSIEVVSAGERDPDAEDVSGMSASKMRLAAADNDLSRFRSGLPRKIQNKAKEVMAMVRAGLELHEQLQAEGLLGESLDITQRRKRAQIMRRYKNKMKIARERAAKRMAKPDTIKKRANKMARAFLRKRLAGKRGAEYVKLSPSEKIQVDKVVDKRKGAIKKIAKRLLPTVRKNEMQRLKSFLQGSKLKHYTEDLDVMIAEMLGAVLNEMTEKQIQNLEKKAARAGVGYDVIEQVYVRGLIDSVGDQGAAFDRVNAFASGSEHALREDRDLITNRRDINSLFESRFVSESQNRADYKVIKVRDAEGRVHLRKIRPKTHVERDADK